MFTGEPEYTLTYTPDFERENKLREFYEKLEKKLVFFSLSPDEKLVTAQNDIEYCCIIGFDAETIDVDNPEAIYNFCLGIEENYSPALGLLKTWLAKNEGIIKEDRPELLLTGISALAKNPGGEYSPTLDMAGLKNCFNHIMLPENGGVFTQSWMLRLVLQIMQPFKNFPLSYPALAQSLFLKGREIKLQGLFNLNLDVLKNKAALARLMQPITGISSGQLKTTDLTPALQLGYTIMEESLARVDETLRRQYRQNSGYDRKDPRMRNLLNFLFDEGVNHFAPHMEEFNERQQRIIKYLFAKRYLGTKELTLDFKCDRKTVQRDFSKLLSTEVVRSIGNGSALKYCINLKTRAYDMLEIYSTPVRRREDYQETLFGQEIWETKKA